MGRHAFEIMSIYSYRCYTQNQLDALSRKLRILETLRPCSSVLTVLRTLQPRALGFLDSNYYRGRLFHQQLRNIGLVGTAREIRLRWDRPWVINHTTVFANR